MGQSSVEHNLLLGVNALQMRFVEHEQLMVAVRLWISDKSRDLGRVFVKEKMLAEDDRALLAALVEKQIENHDGDAGKSLSAVASTTGSLVSV